VKNIYEIDSRYYNELFLLFWQIYCRIFREATRKRNDDDVYVVEPVDIDDSGFTLVETEAEEPKVSGKGGTKPKIKEPKGKTISDVIKLIEKLNEEEGISVQCVQEWLKEIGLFFQSLMEDNALCALLKDANFTEEDKNKKFHDALFSYCRRTLRKRNDVSDVERLVRLIKENEEQLRASFLQQLIHPSLEPDFDFDTTGIDAPSSIDDFKAKTEELYNPTYDEKRVKQALNDLLKKQFAQFRGIDYREFSDVVEAFFTIIRLECIDDLDGINESVPENLNSYFFAKNSDTSLRNIFKAILLDLEPYLRKICYLEKGTIFDKYAGFITVVKEISDLNSLYYTNKPNLARFKTFYNTVYTWRNDNAHKAPKLPKDELEPAIYMVLCIYLYATMVSVKNLEKAGIEFDF
jgi:type I restriction enzyme R subunit